MNEKNSFLRKKSMQLPLTPGVYIMKNKSGEIIYIGKAKALKNRVSQYFGSQNNHSVKVRKMVENVDDFDYVLCDSEFEALVLECSLIKQNMPKYNILLKDDKGYSYIKVTKDKWKNFSVVLQKDDSDSEYIGPFMSSFGISEAVDRAKKIFKIPQCNKKFPADYNKSRPCLNYSIGQCSAPCAGKITFEAYDESVKNALSLIKNGSGEIVDELTKRMNEASDNLEFEKAAKFRDTINSVKKISDKQKVVASKYKDEDIFAIIGAADGISPKACLSVLRFKDYRLYDSEHFIFDYPEDLAQARYELIRDFYTIRSNIPSRIYCDGDVYESELLDEWLSSITGKVVKIYIPQKGEQYNLMEMCRSNAAQKLALYLGRTGKSTAALDELAHILGLKKPPQYIESYDISHTSGSNNVAGMIVFKNGIPYKKSYRKFRINSFSGQDDYASMAETVDRRLNEYEKAIDKEEGFGKLPDLILLDGGQGQVNAVLPILKKHNVTIPLFGMVKDSHHRTRAITGNGEEISLSSLRSAFTLVSEIQEEVHRYAISYHRSVNKKAGISTKLTEIEGIGEARAKSLINHFKTIKAISEADIDELVSVKGMNRKCAEKVFNAFHS